MAIEEGYKAKSGKKRLNYGLIWLEKEYGLYYTMFKMKKWVGYSVFLHRNPMISYDERRRENEKMVNSVTFFDRMYSAFLVQGRRFDG